MMSGSQSALALVAPGFPVFLFVSGRKGGIGQMQRCNRCPAKHDVPEF
jgi:hypothetical protein